jgi:hypothetical protein
MDAASGLEMNNKLLLERNKRRIYAYFSAFFGGKLLKLSVFPLDNDAWTRLPVFVIAVRCFVFLILGRFNGGPVRWLTSRGYWKKKVLYLQAATRRVQVRARRIWKRDNRLRLV